MIGDFDSAYLGLVGTRQDGIALLITSHGRLSVDPQGNYACKIIWIADVCQGIHDVKGIDRQ